MKHCGNFFFDLICLNGKTSSYSRNLHLVHLPQSAYHYHIAWATLSFQVQPMCFGEIVKLVCRKASLFVFPHKTMVMQWRLAKVSFKHQIPCIRAWARVGALILTDLDINPGQNPIFTLVNNVWKCGSFHITPEPGQRPSPI